ncbi:MAG: DUF5686 family protein [Bacteroidota bacterium]|nr:DUF5686 family protein [Bacteroidota bacterium]
MRILSFLLIAFLLPAVLFSQDSEINGTIVDATTNSPLPFVNVVFGDNNGVVSDIDGRFKIPFNNSTDTLIFSSVGYEKLKLALADGIATVKMKALSIELDEVIILPGKNPALRIINNLIDSKSTNTPSLLDSYSYLSHDKFIFTVDNDSLVKRLERKSTDSSLIKAKKFVDKQHLFINESITETKYKKPSKRSERVIAARSSGFKNPFFTLLISQMQSNSFYHDIISLSDKNYINPIAGSAVSKYIYLLKDTIIRKDNIDTTFIIQYLPKPNSNFDALKGLLYINTNRWALENVTAQPANTDKGGVNISIEQKYEFIQNHWFPVQLSTKITVPWVEANGSALLGQGKRYINSIKINPDFNRREVSDMAIDVDSDAYHQPEEVWTSYRQVPLTEKDLETYRVIDSLGKAEHFDRMANGFESVINGAFPVGKMEIMLDKLLHYNKHEGLFLGFGAGTSRRFSDYIVLEASGGYGFRDEEFKYSTALKLFADKHRQHGLSLAYSKQLTEPGSNIFDDNVRAFDEETYRVLLLQNMDFIEEYSFFISNRVAAGLTSKVGVRKQEINPLYNYQYNYLGEVVTDYSIYEVEVKLRFAYKEKLVRNVRSVVALGTKYPIINIAFIKGVDDFSDIGMSYFKFMSRIDYSFYTPFFGETKIRVDGGIANGDLAISKLFNGKASYSDFSLYSSNSFSTMRLNEFFSDRYLALYFSHNFGKLLVDNKYFAPEIVLKHNFLIGDLNNKLNHSGLDFSVPKKGYHESGIVLNNLLKLGFMGYGLAVFYRYGEYELPKVKDNFSFSMTMTMAF